MRKVVYMSLCFMVIGCTQEKQTDQESNEIENDENIENSSQPEVVEMMQNAHGVSNLDGKDISFTFRDKQYARYSFNNQYSYSRSGENEKGEMIIDSWRGDDFQRSINGVDVQVTSKEENGYKSSINSVFYFALLPVAISDPAVNVRSLGDVKIKDQMYTKIEVTFDEEQGGEDHSDIFIYWMNKETHTMDFLAYQYFTEGGGIRFREAFNQRDIEGFRFQDYNNYEPLAGIELIDMDIAYEMGRMELISEIVLTGVKVK